MNFAPNSSESTTSDSLEEPKPLFYVFVYGTLRRGYHNNYLLEESKLVGSAISVENFSLSARKYFVRNGTRSIPFLNKKAKCQIHGEIYEVDADVLRMLDLMEKHPVWYRREEADFALKSDTGKVIKAYAYFNEDEAEIEIPDGNFESLVLPSKY